MKRFLLLLLTTLSIGISNASDNNKLFSCVSGTNELYSGMSNSAAFQIGADVYADSVYYCLNLGLNEGYITMPKEAKLLIKLDSGDILELSNTKDITQSEINHIRNKVVDHYEIYPSYPLSIDNIELLKNHEVEKIRIQLNGSTIDRKIKKFNKKFNKMIQSLNEYIEKKKSASIYDDF